ncbi:hypothetical protein [Nocardioides pantholopis]|uniref:hypothetical protein n=1 Tax=Nocardioides pantholopis TaxID=2483798 RepID=UPI000F09677B|nr:hypothetical protein [Nocardioides pantholopis]
MFPPPIGPELAPDVARRLDDIYFAADPLGYFTARISSLLNGLISEHVDDEPQPASEPSQFDKLVGEVAKTYRSPTLQARRLQTAIDAFAVRHHAAETLLRLAYVLIRRRNGLGRPSVWADVEATPTAMGDVLKGIREGFSINADRWEQFRDLVYPADATNRDDPNIISGVTTFAEWFNFSIQLFEQGPLDVSAAHNKFKHGLGVRIRDDYLVTLVTGGPDERGYIPQSALKGDGAVNLFDRTVLQFLATPGPRKQGSALESTTLRLSPDVLLAQAALIAHTYAAMFCIAAKAHFNARSNRHDVDAGDDCQESPVLTYPGLLVNGPLPEHITIGKALVGMRQPLTQRQDRSDAREAALFYADGSWQTFKVTGPARTGRVVDG